MRKLPAGITNESLPDLGHYRAHGIDRMRAWCHGPMCWHEALLTFDAVAGFERPTRPSCRTSTGACGARGAAPDARKMAKVIVARAVGKPTTGATRST